nr:hypothetical protein [Mycoplasmoidaceae bacterium]
HHKKYYEKMHKEYDEISELINKNSFENVIFKIIDFNERFNPKFFYGFYIIHIALFLDLCSKAKNKFIKK